MSAAYQRDAEGVYRCANDPSHQHQTPGAARMCDAAARTRGNGKEVAGAREKATSETAANVAAAPAPPVSATKSGGGKKGKRTVDADRALKRNAGADDDEPPPPPAAATEAVGKGGSKKGGSKKEESEGKKIPHGLTEAAVNAFAKIYRQTSRSHPYFRADLQKAERRVLRGDCKKHGVISHGRLPDLEDEGTEKSSFHFDPRDTNKEWVAKYIEAYEAIHGKPIGEPKSKGTEAFPVAPEKKKGDKKKASDADEDEDAGGAAEEAGAVEEAEAEDEQGAKAGAKKGASKKSSKKGASKK